MTVSEQVKWAMSGPAVREHPGPWHPTYLGGGRVSHDTPWTCGQAPQPDCPCDECSAECDEAAAWQRIRAHIAAALLAAEQGPLWNWNGDSLDAIIVTANQLAKELKLRRQHWLSPETRYARRPIPNDLRQRVYERDGHRCVFCGSAADLTIDHIVPVSKGGANNLENLCALCWPCNNQKRAR